MYIHFQDWTHPALLDSLSEREVPHGDRILKAFATDGDPRITLDRPALVTLQSNAHPFSREEVYVYSDRESFLGEQLEKDTTSTGLGNVGQRTVRALFRFSYEYGFCQAAMTARAGESWIFRHPFQLLDGIQIARRRPERQKTIHLDLFTPRVLHILKGIIDYEDPEQFLDIEDGTDFLLP